MFIYRIGDLDCVRILLDCFMGFISIKQDILSGLIQKPTFTSYFTFIYTVHRRIEGVYVENIVIGGLFISIFTIELGTMRRIY